MPDNLHPLRIVVGGQGIKAITFAELLREAALSADVAVMLRRGKTGLKGFGKARLNKTVLATIGQAT